jgi:hypothetical protein
MDQNTDSIARISENTNAILAKLNKKDTYEKPKIRIKFNGTTVPWNISDVEELFQELVDSKLGKESSMLPNERANYNYANNYGKIIMLLR